MHLITKYTIVNLGYDEGRIASPWLWVIMGPRQLWRHSQGDAMWHWIYRFRTNLIKAKRLNVWIYYSKLTYSIVIKQVLWCREKVCNFRLLIRRLVDQNNPFKLFLMSVILFTTCPLLSLVSQNRAAVLKPFKLCVSIGRRVSSSPLISHWIKSDVIQGFQFAIYRTGIFLHFKN